MFKNMFRYQEVQSKVRQELDNVLGKEIAPSLQDRIKLPYTEVPSKIEKYFIIYIIVFIRNVPARIVRFWDCLNIENRKPVIKVEISRSAYGENKISLLLD